MFDQLKAKIKKANPSFTDGVFERCVLCHKTTDVPVDLPIQQRVFYIEGGGQLCEDCYCEIYKKSRNI